MYRKKIFNRKILYCSFAFVFVALFTMSIAYAALSVSLKVSGTAEIFSSNWDIFLDNPVVKEGSITDEPPTITSWNTMRFELNFENPGDFYEFTVDVINDGDLDAMISNVTKTPELTAAQAKYIRFDITYLGGNSIATNHGLPAKSSVPIKVRIEYRDDLASLDDLPTTETSLSISLSLTYIQANEDMNYVTGGGYIGTGGSLDEIGTIVTIGTEQFYTIGTEGDNVKLLAMYNLYAGGDYVNEYVEDKWVWNYYPYEDEATWLQDSKMLGYNDYKNNFWRGVLAFSDSPYWKDSVTNYPAYVYNENSILYPYVENYKEYIEEYGAEVLEARLINSEELISLGCDLETNICKDSPKWFYLSAFWTGIAIDEERLYAVEYNPIESPYGSAYLYLPDYDDYEWEGIRPVLVVPKADIPR